MQNAQANSTTVLVLNASVVIGELLGKHQDEEIDAQCEIINWPKYTEVLRNYFSDFVHLFSLFPFFQVRHFFFSLDRNEKDIGFGHEFPEKSAYYKTGEMERAFHLL